MEFVLWFGVALAAVALAGEHMFLVIFLAALCQFVFALASVVTAQRRRSRYPTW